MNKRLILILVCLFGVLTVAFAPDLSGSASTLNSSTASDLINAVNALRASNGLPAYRVNSTLMNIAQGQANYMASIGTWSDYGPGGTLVGQRLLDAGYPLAGDLSGCPRASYPCGFASQNVIQGTASMTAQDAVERWMGDAPHRNTMLSPTLQEIGAAEAVAGNYYYVIVAALASGSKISYTPAAPGATTIVISGTPATQDQTIAVAIVSTPDEKGNIYHEVQPGQTLWQIALAYKTTIDQIKQLNGLSSNDIYPEQKLLIARAGTATPIPPTATATLNPFTDTPLPTFVFFTATPSATETPVLAAPISGPAGAGGAVIAIVLVALVAAGLVAWVGRSRPI